MSSNNLGQLLHNRAASSMTNESKKSNINEPMTIDSKEVDHVADELVAIFSSPGSRLFFCKVAWRIPRARLLQMASVAKADAKSNPAGYFNVMCRRELGSAK